MAWLVACSSSAPPPGGEGPSGQGKEQTGALSIAGDRDVAAEGRPSPAPAGRLTRAKVVEVIDGDTLRVRREAGAPLPSDRVRLIGVDTPEVHGRPEPYGREASRFTRHRLQGRTVWLEKDVSETDRYGRALRYVWLTEPPASPAERDVRENMFNAILLLEGYARLATFPPDVRYADMFVRFQREAREEGRGLWGIPLSGPGQAGDRGAAAGGPGGAGRRGAGGALGVAAAGRDRDCDDFATQAEAQAFFEAAGGPAADPHRLDGDGDGIACEGLP